MNNKLVFIFFILLFTSCKQERLLLFTSESFSEKSLSQCATVTCPEITIDYVLASGDAEVSSLINKAIKKYIISSLHIGEPDEVKFTTSIPEAAETFIATYRMHSAEFPDMKTAYFADVAAEKSHASSNLISIALSNYLFTGGAHGYGSTYYQNFDPQTGLEITINELFSNKEAFTVFAENKFKEAFTIPKNENINSTGFWFEDDTFSLPDSIGFTENTILLHYNPYDIASYADGPIILGIPLNEAKAFLSFEIE